MSLEPGSSSYTNLLNNLMEISQRENWLDRLSVGQRSQRLLTEDAIKVLSPLLADIMPAVKGNAFFELTFRLQDPNLEPELRERIVTTIVDSDIERVMPEAYAFFKDITSAYA